jgi:TonB family protein
MTFKRITVLLAVAVSGAVGLHAQSTATVVERRPIKNLVQPTLPDFAKKFKLAGTVRIEVTIAPNGTVKNTRILGGHPVLAAEAEKAAQRSTFEPGPKETTEVIEFRFSS